MCFQEKPVGACRARREDQRRNHLAQSAARATVAATRLLHGFALDAETPSARIALQWTFAGPSPLASTGAVVHLRELSPGSYTATLTATDTDGATASMARHFEVLPLVIPEGIAPVVDGSPNDPAYADAALVRIPLGGGQYARAHLTHAGGALYASFSNLRYASVGSRVNRHVGLRMDPNSSSNALGQPGDVGFFVDEDGIPSQEVGTGTGMSPTLSPKPGFTVAIQRGPTSWSAELRIDDSLLGGWNHTAGLMLDHDTPHWPPPATDASPGTWAPAYLGTVLPAQPNRAPLANAGADQRYAPRTTRTIYLDGAASNDPDGNPLTYHWKQVGGPAITLVKPDDAIAAIQIGPVTTTTLYTFELRVNDGLSDSLPAQVRVLLEPAPFLPPAFATAGFANLGSDGELRLRLTGIPGQSYRIEASEDLEHWSTLRTVYSDYAGRIDATQLLTL